jgi:hypothetical protein
MFRFACDHLAAPEELFLIKSACRSRGLETSITDRDVWARPSLNPGSLS